MGVTAGLHTIRDENLHKVLADPPLIWAALSPDDPEALTEARARRGDGRGLFARLFGRPAPPAPPAATLTFADGELAECDLDKSWHGLHFLLTGDANHGELPLAFLLVGGAAVDGGGDLGARLFTAAETAALDAALAPIDESVLRTRYDKDAMTKQRVYPAIWDRDPADDDALGYLVDNFAEMKAFVATAARGGFGLVVTIS